MFNICDEIDLYRLGQIYANYGVSAIDTLINFVQVSELVFSFAIKPLNFTCYAFVSILHM